jgi:hypothetical protein
MSWGRHARSGVELHENLRKFRVAAMQHSDRSTELQAESCDDAGEYEFIMMIAQCFITVPADALSERRQCAGAFLVLPGQDCCITK